MSDSSNDNALCDVFVPRLDVSGVQPLARFWSRVRVGIKDECWPWLGHVGDNGYGKSGAGGAHRKAAAMCLPGGKVPRDLHVCHRCDNKLCCNPHHLFLGTPKANSADCVAKGRQRGGKPKRPNFTPEQRQAVIDAVARGATRREAAELVGMTERNVYHLLRKAS